MTAVIFKFQQPDGDPVANAPFVVTVRKPSFDETIDAGILLPGDVAGLTDANGECTLELAPGNGIYYLTMDLNQGAVPPDDCMSGLRYKFIVPESATPVKVETLIVSAPTWSRPWDEQALAIIVDAKAASTAAAAQAKASAEAAQASEESVAKDAQDAREAAAQAAIDAELAAHAAELAQKAIDSAVEAVDAAARAKQSEEAANLSEVASRTYAEHAGASEEAATSASTVASEQAGIAVSATQAATLSAERAAASEQASKNSELSAQLSKESAAADAAIAADAKADVEANADTASAAATAATGAANAAGVSADAATQAATQTGNDRTEVAANTLKVEQDAAQVALDAANTAQNAAEAKTARDQAVDAAASIAGALVEMGGISLASNQYPPKPAVAGIWKVTAGGIVDGVDYGIGDSLVYSKTLDQFYKIDNTEAVSSVNGKTGVVVLSKSDVGLSLADNTPDTTKPVSTPQAAAIAAKEPVIASGNALEYWNGQKQWVSIYASVRAASLTGFVTTSTAAVTAVDTVLIALGKLQAQNSLQDTAIAAAALKGVNNDITELQALSVPLSIAQGGNGGTVGLNKASANATLNNGRYITGSTWTGSVFAGTDAKNQGYLAHDNYSATAAYQSWISLDSTVTRRQRFKTASTWGEWIEVSSGSGSGAGLSVGTTYPWTVSRATIPAGSLPRDGQLLDRATWPDLWALVSSSAVTDAVWLAAPYDQRGKYSSGNGTTTFRMPDTNGKHADGNTIAAMTLRGDGKLSAGAVGVHQRDQFQGHDRNTGVFTIAANSVTDSSVPAGSPAAANGQVVGTSSSNYARYNQRASGYLDDGTNGVARTGLETRGSNETVIWCTHAAAALNNPGLIDVASVVNTVNALANNTAKAFARCTSGTSPTIVSGSGFTAISRVGTGVYTLTLAAGLTNATLIATTNASVSFNQSINVSQDSATTIRVTMGNANAAYDFPIFSVVAF